MLFDRHFWLAKAVGAAQRHAATPWISPSPASRARGRPPRPPWSGGGQGRGEEEGSAAGGGGGGGRCAVCVVQKKGRCGTDTAPARCLRRGGRGRADALEDPFGASEPPDEPFLATDSPPRKPGASQGGGGAPGPSAAAPAPARRPPPTPLPAASTAAIASMRAAERREKRRARAAAAATRGKGVGGVAREPRAFPRVFVYSSSESESESEPVSAAAELANLSAALDGDPALRAAAPRDAVEGDAGAAVQLMWQQQANRHDPSLLGRVLDAADEESERFAEAEGELAGPPRTCPRRARCAGS